MSDVKKNEWIKVKENKKLKGKRKIHEEKKMKDTTTIVIAQKEKHSVKNFKKQ